jgi:uncharacterized protein (TIGR03067 family)
LIDLTASPKTMDLTFTEGPQTGKTALGIYKVEGDTYRLCRAAPGKPTPAQSEPNRFCLLSARAMP